MSNTIHATYHEAIDAEIIPAIEREGYAPGDFDTELIADLALEYDSVNGREGYRLTASPEILAGMIHRQAR